MVIGQTVTVTLSNRDHESGEILSWLGHNQDCVGPISVSGNAVAVHVSMPLSTFRRMAKARGLRTWGGDDLSKVCPTCGE